MVVRISGLYTFFVFIVNIITNICAVSPNGQTAHYKNLKHVKLYMVIIYGLVGSHNASVEKSTQFLIYT